jgi:hypothetical protein
VHIISAPFQEIQFNKKFDIIFCIGVLEYSNKFVEEDDPYNSIIQYFSRHLTEDGILVIAIENRFGLKYFNSASEDHTGRKFDSIEDYPANAAKAKTFGYNELKEMLSKEFGSTEFFFPFPDYKVPDAVFSQELLEATDIGGLLGKFMSRDYSRPYRPLFSEKYAWNSIAENKLIPIFSNSFLIVAGKSDNNRMVLDGLGVVKNTDRVASFQTCSKIYRDKSDCEIRVEKKAINSGDDHDLLKICEYDEPWYEGKTLQSILMERAFSGNSDIDFIFEPAKDWYAFVSSIGNATGASGNLQDTHCLSSYYDAIWQNTIISDGTVRLVDQEWTIVSDIEPKHILIRSIYTFLNVILVNKNIPNCLKYRSGATLIKDIGRVFGETISKEDLAWLVNIESSVYSSVTGKRRIYHEVGIRIKLLLNLAIARYLLEIVNNFEYLVFARQLFSRLSSRLLVTLKKPFISN